MKKIGILLFVMALFLLGSGCSGDSSVKTTATQTPSAETGSTAQASEPAAPETASLQGETYSADKFSIIVPAGWEVMDVDGGVQLYKSSGEIIEVHFRGENQSEDHAKQQVEENASTYSGTEPKETELMGKKYWTTTFTASGVEQTSYLRMEDGVMLSIKCAKGNYESDPEYAAILDSIVFN
jgi:hypothetical protein